MHRVAYLTGLLAVVVFAGPLAVDRWSEAAERAASAHTRAAAAYAEHARKRILATCLGKRTVRQQQACLAAHR